MADMTNEELDKLLVALINRFAVAVQNMSAEQLKAVAGPIGDKLGALLDDRDTIEDFGLRLVGVLVKLGYKTDVGRGGEPVVVSSRRELVPGVKAKLSFTQALKIELDAWFDEYIVEEAKKIVDRR